MAQQIQVRADPGPYTWNDFIELEEDDPRELLDGRLVEIEVPTLSHERIVAQLIFALEGWIRAGNGGLVIGSGYKIRIDEQRGAMPDVQFYDPVADTWSASTPIPGPPVSKAPSSLMPFR